MENKRVEGKKAGDENEATINLEKKGGRRKLEGVQDGGGLGDT